MSDEKQTDLKKIKELVDLMKANDLVELEIVDGHNKVHLKRPGPVSPSISQIPMAPVAVPSEPAAAAEPQAAPAEEKLVEIKSPIVGTFYSSPSPDSESYAMVDTRVNPDTVVCIIEAMKVMNEIKAETSGTIVEVLCTAGQAIDYGQALFRVKPD